MGEFGDDNRAGIDRTLHRVSAMRTRGGRIVGLTCRVGRAISGSAEMVRDLVASGGSLLLMGPPGVGKTTAIRFAPLYFLSTLGCDTKYIHLYRLPFTFLHVPFTSEPIRVSLIDRISPFHVLRNDSSSERFTPKNTISCEHNQS